jgi:hypothetical protein
METSGETSQGKGRSWSHNTAAWVLITLGGLLLLGNLFNIHGGLVLIVLGGAFLAGYFTTRNYGLLIPAMILIGLGIGVSLSDLELFGINGYWVLFCLGLGFAGIYLIDRFSWSQSGSWSLWPGGFLILIAIWGAAYEAGWLYRFWWDLLDFLRVWWPILLILWGIVLLRRRREPASHEEGETPIVD